MFINLLEYNIFEKLLMNEKKLSTLVTIDRPNPTPESNNVSIINTWFKKNEI